MNVIESVTSRTLDCFCVHAGASLFSENTGQKAAYTHTHTRTHLLYFTEGQARYRSRSAHLK